MKKKMQEISTPICDFVRDYAESGMSRFHMPGHKGRGERDMIGSCSPERPDLFSQNLFSCDITEIKGADSLYEARGIIEESEKNASRIFGTGATFFSTEGSSHCIRAMLALATQFASANASGTSFPRPLILAARNVHHSFLTACALLDLDVEWLYPESDAWSLCACPVSARLVRNKLEQLAQLPAAVYLTSPDYLGNQQDIQGIAQVCHAFGIPLLTDNAHGAYLHFLKTPQHPMDLGADLCCDSAHKTLPALTGCAYLHIAEASGSMQDLRSLCIANAKKALSMFGSTSPSYLLLQSLDQLNPLLSGIWPERLNQWIERIRGLRQDLSDLGWQFIGTEPLKLTLHASGNGFSGNALAGLLRGYQIECEYSDPDDLVLMISPNNTPEDLNRLIRALKEIRTDRQFHTFPDPAQSVADKETGMLFSDWLNNPPVKKITIREAAFAASRMVPVEDSAGHICTDLAISCPPAIPVLICGEQIPPQAVQVLKHYRIETISVLDESVSS